MIATPWPHDLQKYFDAVYWPRKIGRSPNTKRLYCVTIRVFGRFLGRPALVADLDDDTASAFIAFRAENVSLFAADKDRRNLSAIATFAAKKRHLAEFPDYPRVSLPKRNPRALTIAEIDRVLSACSRVPGMIGAARACDWWLAYYLLALVTGERTGAMLALRWEWLRGDCLAVPGECRKDRKPCVYSLPQVVLSALQRLPRSELIFAMPFGVCTFYLRNKRILRAAELPATRQYQPQVCRRTFASWLESEGGNATEALGHTQRRTTKESYLDRTIAVDSPSAGLVARKILLRKEWGSEFS